MSNPNFDTLVATTLKNYRANLADNITNHQVLWLQLKERGFIREDEGGTSIVEPLLIERNSTVKAYSGYDIIDTTPQQGITAAEFLWKQVAGTVTISGEEEFKNAGSKTKVISLLQSKIQQLELSMMLEINRQLQGDGTGTGGKEITGLGLAVEDGTTFSVYGGIDSQAFPYWRNQWAGNIVISGFNTTVSGTLFLNALRTMYNSCSRGKVKPTLIMSTQQVFELYEALLVPNERFMDMRLGDAGFLNLMFKATPWVFDDDMPGSGFGISNNHELVMLNADFLKFVIGKGKNFVVTDFVRPENQDAKVSQTIMYGNLTCCNRQRQGRMNIDITA